MILQRQESHMVGDNSLLDYQFGFWKGMSTVDAIQSMVDIVIKVLHTAKNA